MNITQTNDIFAFQDISQYFVDGFAWIDNRLMQAVFDRDGQMGYHGVLQVPIYAYKATANLISPVTDTDALLARFCGIGVKDPVREEYCTVRGHGADATNGYPAAVAWLDSLLGGTYAQTYQTVGCTVRNVTVNITDSLN